MSLLVHFTLCLIKKIKFLNPGKIKVDALDSQIEIFSPWEDRSANEERTAKRFSPGHPKGEKKSPTFGMEETRECMGERMHQGIHAVLKLVPNSRSPSFPFE